ncbi:MAG: hypothetical protein ABJ331_21610, partial [Marinobacter sp.]|uniref:hypothetical protein n=1 Tax=Marinobacter sp. TaxID=50741 RepID=UPI003299A38C
FIVFHMHLGVAHNTNESMQAKGHNVLFGNHLSILAYLSHYLSCRPFGQLQHIEQQLVSPPVLYYKFSECRNYQLAVGPTQPLETSTGCGHRTEATFKVRTGMT